MYYICVDFTTLQQYLIGKYKIDIYTTLELTEMTEINSSGPRPCRP